MASQAIYQLYTELQNYKPKIWRRFQVAGNISVARLGYILMTLYEMEASHPFSITVPVSENMMKSMGRGKALEQESPFSGLFSGLASREQSRRYEVLPEEMFSFDLDEKMFDAVENKIGHALECPGWRLVMHYDFGDDWEISVVLEDILHDSELPGRELPRVLDGAGYGIIEDCGGVEGLKSVAGAFKRRTGRLYEDFRAWLGCDDLDLTMFDLEDMNFRLKRVPRIYSDIYERHIMPTPRSVSLLKRRYKKKGSLSDE